MMSRNLGTNIEIDSCNDKILELKRDNQSWVGCMQTPNLVDDIKPVRMIEK